ncbi:Phosphocarrier protein of PTS system [Lachnospiraceae bacterium TWA4]|nr:Phosphocarrier protein of PTS system [Lachnospiraceae bacterium TWA4]
MKQFTYVITDAQGIHARPAGTLVKVVKEFSSTITIAKDGKEVKANGVLGVMSLGAKQGEEITIKADGADEDAAIAKLEEFLKANL